MIGVARYCPRQVELARLLQRVGEIGAGDREHDHLGFRGLGGDQKRTEIGGVEGRAQASDDVSTGFGDGVARVGFERSAEGVIGGDEEEAVELLLDQKPHQRDPVRPIVGVPLHAIRRASLGRQVG